MTTRKYSSRSQQTTLTGAITSGATSMTVVSGTALLGGVTIPAGTTFTLVIDVDTALEEIVDATAVSTNTFTITRAIDGSSAQDHSAGAVVRHMAIGRDYRDANLHAEASAYYNDGSGTGHTMHGIASGEGDVVGTAKTQTLTNKTLTSPTISDPTITGTASAGAVLVFEGTTADAYETTLTVVDPTQDNTITLPNTTGNVVIDSATQTLTNKTLTSPTISGSPVITGLSSAGMISSSATPKDYVDSILGSATAAATSAASAATSAASAATSATSAAASATASATSASASATSATAAATSATSAAASATAASTSASSAATSATSAQAWAIQLVNPVSGTDYSAKYNANLAATSASSAATSASSAATSASSAATSATSAANSATASATSASAAATSATSAAASATAAATSATSAAASATAAATSATSAAASATAAAGYVVPSQTGNAGKFLATDGTAVSWSNSANNLDVTSSTAPANGVYLPAANTLGFATNSTRVVTIDSTGKVGLGTTSPTQILSIYSATGATIISEGDSTTFNILSRSSTDTTSAALVFRKARGTSASRTVVSSGDFLGNIIFAGYDGASNIIAGSITSAADAAPSTGIIPGRLMFNTADSAGTLTERMRITSGGLVGIGMTPAVTLDITGANVRLTPNTNVATNGFTFNGSSGNALWATMQSYKTQIDAVTRFEVLGSGITSIGTSAGTAMMQIVNIGSNTANPVLLVKGAASQTGDLTQWQNSAGAVSSYISASGIGYFSGLTLLRQDSSSEGGQINLNKSLDNTLAWYIDINGTTSTPSFRIVDSSAAAVRLIIDASGTVGIGTSSPNASYKLDVNGAVRTNGNNVILGGNALQLLESTNNNSYFLKNDLNTLTIVYNSTERMRIDGSGNTTINSIAAGTTSTAAVGGGYMGLPQNSTTTGAYTVVAADAGKHIYSTATRTVTIDSNANLALPVGTTLTFISGVGATTTIAITTDTMYLAGTGTTGSRTLAAYGMATAVKIASTTWIISGNGLT